MGHVAAAPVQVWITCHGLLRGRDTGCSGGYIRDVGVDACVVIGRQGSFKDVPRAGRNSLGVSNNQSTHRESHIMVSNRIHTIARTAAGSTLVASVLGLSALGFSSVANAAPAQAPQAGPAAQSVCWYTHHPEIGWWYC